MAVCVLELFFEVAWNLTVAHACSPCGLTLIWLITSSRFSPFSAALYPSRAACCSASCISLIMLRPLIL